MIYDDGAAYSGGPTRFSVHRALQVSTRKKRGLSFPKISSGRDSRREAESSHRSGRCFRGAKLSHGETVSGKAKGRPPQEGRHPRCRPRARAHPPSIRPSPPGTVQGLLRRAHILSEEPWHRSNPNLDNPP